MQGFMNKVEQAENWRQFEDLMSELYSRMSGGESGHGSSGGQDFGLPPLAPYLGMLVEDFLNYIREVVPRMMPRFDASNDGTDRLEELISMVEEELWAEDGPNMDGFFDMVKSLEFSEDQQEEMMGGIRNYMSSLMERILSESGFEGDIEGTVASLNQSLESMGPEQYLRSIASAFSGKGDMGGVEDFINTDFQMPDLSENKEKIYNDVTKYLTDNLTAMNMDEATIQTVVEQVQNELTQAQGPDFSLLPQLMSSVGLDDDMQ